MNFSLYARKLYSKYFKKIPFVRPVVIFFYMYVYVGFNKKIRLFLRGEDWKSLVPLGRAAAELGGRESEISFPSTPMSLGVGFPEISGRITRGVYCVALDNCEIRAGTNMVISSDKVIIHDQYDFFHDSTSEELHGRIIIDWKKSRVLLSEVKLSRVLPLAAAFLDSCATNYAHWLTEVLPRISAFCSDSRFAGIPIVVDFGLHDNIYESLYYVVSGREVILLKPGEAALVNELFVISATGYVPFAKRRLSEIYSRHGDFSWEALRYLREVLNSRISVSDSLLQQKKIFIRRAVGARRLVNGQEIESVLTKMGFFVMSPEEFSFAQQVAFFSNADIVVAPTGAALANIIFMKSRSRVYVLMARHQDMAYSYWSHIAAPFGVKVSLVLGEITGQIDQGIHADFFVSAESVGAELS